MGFQIRNKEGQAIDMIELDKETAAFWGKELEQKHYADPIPAFVNTDNLEGIELTRAQMRHELNSWPSWFDMIGWNIHHPQTIYTSGWDNVKCSMWAVQAYRLYKHLYKPQELNVYIEATKGYLKPYFDLVDHWEAKGYTPHQVED